MVPLRTRTNNKGEITGNFQATGLPIDIKDAMRAVAKARRMRPRDIYSEAFENTIDEVRTYGEHVLIPAPSKIGGVRMWLPIEVIEEIKNIEKSRHIRRASLIYTAAQRWLEALQQCDVYTGRDSGRHSRANSS